MIDLNRTFHEPGINGIAFLFHNALQRAGLSRFIGMVSIDSVESVTGIDFFPNFPNEDQIEKTSSIEQWSWTRVTKQVTTSNQGINDSGHPTIKRKQSPAQSQECQGITKSGTRCKNKTSNSDGYCHLHEGQAKGQD